jgi:hypothetical protein
MTARARIEAIRLDRERGETMVVFSRRFTETDAWRTYMKRLQQRPCMCDAVIL